MPQILYSQRMYRAGAGGHIGKYTDRAAGARLLNRLAMRLMRQTDYALRVLLYLGARAERHCSISEMARAYGISHNHLTKVVHDLVKAGYLRSVRGRLGGVALARPPAEINIGAIVRMMECDLQLADCAHCAIAGRCGIEGVLGRALRAFLAELDAYTLADVIPEPSFAAGLLGIPNSVDEIVSVLGQ